MHIKLIHKFILIFAVIGIAEFVPISTLGSHMVQHRLVKSEGLKLYKEAAKISQSDVLTNGIDEDSFSSLYRNLHALAGYQDCEIWLLGSDGTIYMNTAGESATDDSGDAEYPVLEGFEFDTTFAADGSSIKVGDKVTIHTDSAQVTATTTSGVFTVLEKLGSGELGTAVRGKF